MLIKYAEEQAGGGTVTDMNIAADRAATADKRSTEVESAMNDLGKAKAGVQMTLSLIVDRLQPILGRGGEEDGPGNADDLGLAIPSKYASPHAQNIYEVASSLTGTERLLSKILKQLEI